MVCAEQMNIYIYKYSLCKCEIYVHKMRRRQLLAFGRDLCACRWIGAHHMYTCGAKAELWGVPRIKSQLWRMRRGGYCAGICAYNIYTNTYTPFSDEPRRYMVMDGGKCYVLICIYAKNSKWAHQMHSILRCKAFIYVCDYATVCYAAWELDFPQHCRHTGCRRGDKIDFNRQPRNI